MPEFAPFSEPAPKGRNLPASWSPFRRIFLLSHDLGMLGQCVVAGWFLPAFCVHWVQIGFMVRAGSVAKNQPTTTAASKSRCLGMRRVQCKVRLWGLGARSRTSILMSLLFSIAFASTPRADARTEIQKQYDRWSIAYTANDVTTLLDILSPGYTLTNFEKETMDYKTYVAYLNLRKNGPKDVTRYKTLIKKLSLKGQVAEVDAIETMRTTKPEPNTGRTLLSIHSHEYIDHWKRTAKGWRLLSTTTILESTKILKTAFTACDENWDHIGAQRGPRRLQRSTLQTI